MASTVLLSCAVLGTAALAACDRTPAPSNGWSYSFDAGTHGQLEQGRVAVRKLTAEITESGLRPVGTAKTTHRGRVPDEITEIKTTWRGRAFDLPELQVEIFERDVLAEGPEIVVSISAAVPSDDAAKRFRELQQHVLGLFGPSSPR